MNTNVKDRLRCAYEDCAEAHPLANESTYEQVTCLTCRAALGLPPTEIYKNSGATIAATPKPRAGEHLRVKADPELLSYWRTKPAASNEVLACDIIESLQRELDATQKELTLMKTAGIIEVSLRNPAVSEYVDHWERRTEIAEAERDLLREREKVLVAAIEAALAYCESEAIGTVQQEIADNERMRKTLRDALEYGR